MTNKQAEDILEKIKAMPFEEGFDKALSLRSDDFGHDCTMLLQAESELLQHFGHRFIHQLAKAHAAGHAELLAQVLPVLEFYSKGGNFQTDIWQHSELGYFTGKRARELLQKLKDKIREG